MRRLHLHARRVLLRTAAAYILHFAHKLFRGRLAHLNVLLQAAAQLLCNRQLLLFRVHRIGCPLLGKYLFLQSFLQLLFARFIQAAAAQLLHLGYLLL